MMHFFSLKRWLYSVFAWLLLFGICAGQAPVLEAPFVINCGPAMDDWERGLNESDSIPLYPDREWESERESAYGHEGGEGRRFWLGGTWGWGGQDLFGASRLGLESYRIQIAPGQYMLTLGFCETVLHAPGQRVFDVLVGDELWIDNLDPLACAEFSESFLLRRPLSIENTGILEIVFRPETGAGALVSMIRLDRARDDGAISLQAPEKVWGMASYDCNALFWEHTEPGRACGYRIERSEQPNGPFETIAKLPFMPVRWLDQEVRAGQEYVYRIRSIDGEGKPGPPSHPVSLRSFSRDDSSFPVYEVTLAPDSLNWMLGNVSEDRTTKATFRLNGREYPVEIRIRGGSSRYMARKSYRIEFLETWPWPDMPGDVLNLKAEHQDFTLLQEHLSCTVFRDLELPVSGTRFANLFINDRYQGVYLDVEPIRSPFKEHPPLDPRGTLIRSATFQGLDREELGDLRGDVGDLDELRAFLQQINRLDRGEFEAFIRGATDWEKVRDFWLANLLVHRAEIEANDYFFYREPDRWRWWFLPWDHNNGNWCVQGFGRHVGEPFMPLFGQTLQGIGRNHPYWYVLPSRAFHQDSLRREYLEQVAQKAREVLINGKAAALIEGAYQTVSIERERDPFHWPPGRVEFFQQALEGLTRFSGQHGRRLLEMVEEERSRPAPPVRISEFMFGPERGWVELENTTSRQVSLNGAMLAGNRAMTGPFFHFERDAVLGPGEFRVWEFRVRPEGASAPAYDDDWAGLEPEEMERREQERLRARREGLFPGFDWQGGFVGLIGPGRREEPEFERDDRGGGPVWDWYFYGRQTAGFSYGRAGSGFGFMNPSPGSANSARIFLAPPLMISPTVEKRKDSAWFEIQFSKVLPSAVPKEIVMMIRSDNGRSFEVPMNLEVDKATAEIALTDVGTQIEYYFIARSAIGIERAAPLTGSAFPYLARIPAQ